MDRSISYGFYAGGKDADMGVLGAGWKLGTPIYALGDGRSLCDDSKGFGRALSGAGNQRFHDRYGLLSL